MATWDLLLITWYEKIIGLCIFPKNFEKIRVSGSLNLKRLLWDEFFTDYYSENSDDAMK